MVFVIVNYTYEQKLKNLTIFLYLIFIIFVNNYFPKIAIISICTNIHEDSTTANTYMPSSTRNINLDFHFYMG